MRPSCRRRRARCVWCRPGSAEQQRGTSGGERGVCLRRTASTSLRIARAEFLRFSRSASTWRKTPRPPCSARRPCSTPMRMPIRCRATWPPGTAFVSPIARRDGAEAAPRQGRGSGVAWRASLGDGGRRRPKRGSLDGPSKSVMPKVEARTPPRFSMPTGEEQPSSIEAMALMGEERATIVAHISPRRRAKILEAGEGQRHLPRRGQQDQRACRRCRPMALNHSPAPRASSAGHCASWHRSSVAGGGGRRAGMRIARPDVALKIAHGRAVMMVATAAMGER